MRETTRNPADEELMARLADRDTAAMGEVYDRFAPRLYGLILKIVGDRTDAEDVLQQVFWHAWREGGRYDRRLASPSVWLIMIARSRAVDHVRRRRRVRGVSTEGSFIEVADRRVPIAGADEPASPARRALAKLPDEQREAVCLAFYRGLTHPQIAESQNVPLGTVKTRIRLGMTRLRELLHETSEVSPR